jgi:hypothetical protein
VTHKSSFLYSVFPTNIVIHWWHNLGHWLIVFGSKFLMHSSFISLVVFSLFNCLFHVLGLFKSCTNLCLV